MAVPLRTTFEVATMAKASWAPDAPLSTNDEESVGRYVRATLRFQARLDASAYLVPGFVPDDKHEDLRGSYATIASIVLAFDELPPKPLVLS